MTLIAVTYHYIRPCFEQPFAGIHGVIPSALENQLRLLATVGEFVSVSQVRDAVRREAPLPPRALLVTFDDGLREQVDHALPVIDRLGIPAVFFVNTQPIARRLVTPVHQIHLLRAYTPPERFRALLHEEARRGGVDVRIGDDGDATAAYPWDPPGSAQLKYCLNHRLAPETRDALIGRCFRARFGDAEVSISRDLYMDVEQLRTLSARGYLGTHGDRHLALGYLSRVAVREDVRLSLDLLTRWTGVRPFALSYPFGTFDTTTLAAQAAVAAEGVELAFTTERAGNADLSRPLHLARFDCNDLPGGRAPRVRADRLFETAPPARWYR